MELPANIFPTVRSDLEANATEENVLNLYFHTALLLFKLEQSPIDIERVREVIEEMKKTIEKVVVRLGPVSAKDSEDEMSVGTNRVRWKAIYPSGLLARFLPPDEPKGPTEALRERVETMLQNGQLLLAEGYTNCIKPLGGGPLELGSPVEREGKSFTVFEVWINDFPLFPLAGGVLGRA